MLGVVGFAIFIIFEQKWAKYPLIPLAKFANRTCIITFICSSIHGLAVWCLMYYIPLYYEAIKRFNTRDSGLATLPETVSMVIAATVGGCMVTWLGRYRWAIWLGWAASSAGMGLLILLESATPTAGWIGLNLLVGIGLGLISGTLQFPIQASVETEQIPVAVSLFMFCRSFGAVSCTTVCNPLNIR